MLVKKKAEQEKKAKQKLEDSKVNIVLDQSRICANRIDEGDEDDVSESSSSSDASESESSSSSEVSESSSS